MALLPTYSLGLKKHSCEYSNPKICCQRPKTRRHPDDTPRSKRLNRYSSTPKESKDVGQSDRTIDSKNTDLHLDYVTSTSISFIEADRKFCSRVDKYDRPNEVSLEGKKAQSDGDRQGACNSLPKNIPGSKSSVEEHEYLQFLLRITEDIIKNELYTNKEMQKVFTSHIKANNTRLELDRMLLKIHELMKELDIPLDYDGTENSTSSWTDVAITMGGLLQLENEKSKVPHTVDTKNRSTVQGKCICFDLKGKHSLAADPKQDMNKEGEENQAYTPKSQFQSSLDRLTEHTEPLSSLGTCKVSTIYSNFDDVDILPGFECLETPKVSKGVLCEIHYKGKKVPRSIQTICHMYSIRTKVKYPPHKLKRRKMKKHKKKIHKRKRGDSKKAGGKKYKSENIQCEISKNILDYGTPIIINAQQIKEKESIRKAVNNEMRDEEDNDYILIRGPVYIPRKFLKENSGMLVRNESGTSMKSLSSSKLPSGKISESDFTPEINDILLQLTMIPSSVIMSEQPGFDNSEIEGEDHHYEAPESFISNSLCRPSCPNKSSCNKLILALKNAIQEENSRNSTEEYDLTPQKENHEDFSMKHFVTPEMLPILHNFLSNKEIQTEDIPHNSALLNSVGIISDLENTKDPVTDQEELEKINRKGSEKELEQYNTKNVKGSELITLKSENDNDEEFERSNKENIQDPEIMTPPEQQKNNEKDYLSMKMIDPTYLNQFLTIPKDSIYLYDSRSFPKNPRNEAIDNEVPIVDSSLNDGTIASTATVERTKQFLETEEEIARKNIAPLLSEMTDLQEKDDSGDKHVRKVSIVENPIVQVTQDKLVTENDETKKMGESIIRTVEGLKERQTTRDPHLDKVLQEIESSRESRAISERPFTPEVSEHFAPPGPSALKRSFRN